MEDSIFCSRCPRDFQVCSSSPDSAHSVFNIKYSELANSKYSYFLYGFKDEQDFEEFKQDLRDFQKLRNEFYGGVLNGSEDCENLLDVKEELQFIRRPNNVCKNRRRAHAKGTVNEFYKKPVLQSTSSIKPPRKSVVAGDASSSEKTCPHNTTDSEDGQKLTQLVKEGHDSCVFRVNFDRLSGLIDLGKNIALRSSVKTVLMEFLNGDEHFQEFERVFETFNNRRDREDFDANRRMSLDGNSRSSGSSNRENHESISKSSQHVSSRCANDIFADFFDNDETFSEFEREFEKFRSNRRSNLSGSVNSIGSSCDIFGDVKSYCERNMNSKSSSVVSVNSCSSQDEATPSCGDEAVHQDLIWRSVEDWEKILRKMRRNSRLLLDTCCPEHKYKCRHPSISRQPQDGLQSDAYQKTQSLADLRQCHGDCALPQTSFGNSPSSNWARSSSPHVSDGLQRSSSSRAQGKQNSQENLMLDSTSLSDTLSNGSDCDSSSGQWSDTFEDDNRYSSTSTLCSDNSELCCSFSCSCNSDLHIEDETDDDLLMDSRSAPRTRSHSLMELPSQARPNYLGLHTISADNLHACNRCSLMNSHLRDSPLRGADIKPCDSHNSPYLDDDTPTDDDGSILSGGLWSRPPSSVSVQLSDAESEHYHSATSDLSDHYSTAKSDLSHLLSEPGFRRTSRTPSFDLSEAPCPAADTSDRVFEWTRQGHGVKDDSQPVSREYYHTYHGRSLTGLACQYTCHQHCVPAVTLNCKSISDDGFGAAARTPSPSDPRSHLETSLSIGSISTRPGCARIVPNISSNTRSEVTAKVSGSVPDFQHIVPRSEAGRNSSIVHPNLSREHVGTPKTAAHYLSRSASEGYVTAHSSSVSQPDVVSTSQPSQEQHIKSSQRSPSYSNSRPGTLRQTHIQAQTPIQSQLKSALPNSEQDNVGVNDNVTQGNCSSTNSNTSQNLGSSDNKSSNVPEVDVNQEATTEKDETDSGYRSGTIPGDKLPRVPSQATLDHQELSRKIAKYNHFVPAASLGVTGKESFQGFVKVTMNLIRPITMELGARPPSIYELLTREHIVEENTQQVAFYMPRDTHKSLHITSDTTTKEVVTSLLKKFHILDHPRKFAMYEQEFSDRNKLVRLRRLTDKDFPLRAIVSWDPERITNYRMVLQENETGEIVWDVFSLPELGNFLRVLDREEKETILELKHKYAYMKQYMERRMTELRNERNKQS